MIEIFCSGNWSITRKRAQSSEIIIWSSRNRLRSSRRLRRLMTRRGFYRMESRKLRTGTWVGGVKFLKDWRGQIQRPWRERWWDRDQLVEDHLLGCTLPCLVAMSPTSKWGEQSVPIMQSWAQNSESLKSWFAVWKRCLDQKRSTFAKLRLY